MKTLKLKVKETQEFISNYGSSHKEAVIIVTAVNNNIMDKKLDIAFKVYNSINDLEKQPIDFGFILSFSGENTDETTVNSTTGEVIRWGTPCYSEVLKYFDIVDEGIALASLEVEMWFLNKVEFQSKQLVEQWEVF
jgi:hypothetical protein